MAQLDVRARRDDIQGLRAIGALLVAIFHIWIGRVSGGVDVFFVVSGFLLIGSLHRELRKSGAIDFLGFVSRLSKRLLPSAFFVILVVMLSAPLWMPAVRWRETTSNAIASSLYLENWYLARASIDYLARDSVASPFQHYWAMSVQVQSLIAISLLLAGLGIVLRRLTINRGVASTLFLTAIFAVSLAYSIYATATNQPVAYFNSFARVWEFAMGGLVAILLTRLNLSETTQLIGGWIGLLLIVSCGVFLKVSTIFPGYAALWPTGGAALVLLCGAGTDRFSVGRLLAWKPLNWLGDISYALYLWHWPLLVAYLTVTYQTTAPFGAGFAILAVSVLLAWGTTRVVEAPFRRARDTRPWLSIAVGAVAAVALVGASGGARIYLQRAAPADKLASPDPIRYPGAAVFDGRYSAMQGGLPVMPGPLWMKEDVSPLYGRGCHEAMTSDQLRSCSFGDPAAPNVLAVVGGSHSAHWVSALQIALQGKPWRIVTFTKSGCLLRVHDAAAAERSPSCARWNEKLMARLIQLRPEMVFTIATHGSNGSREHVPPDFEATWRTLVAHGIAVAAVRDNPWFDFDIPECVQVNGATSERCRQPRAGALASVNPLDTKSFSSRVHYLDLTDHFCTDEFCPTVAGNIVMYSDRHHVTNAYMRTLAPYLARQLSPVLDVEGQRSRIRSTAAARPLLSHSSVM